MKLEIRISWSDASKTSVDVAAVLESAGVAGDIQEGLSVCKGDDGVFRTERSAVLRVYDISRLTFLNLVWPGLRDSLGLSCAHVKEINEGFSGCVRDYAAPSLCPHGSWKGASTPPPAPPPVSF